MEFSLLQKNYSEGSITKSEFIDQALTTHQTLWQYSEYLSACDVHSITISEGKVCFVVGPEFVKLTAPIGESRVAPLEILNFKSYEPVESQAMNILACGATAVLDVGANIGYHSIRLALRDPQLKVYSFEPLPSFAQSLQYNISLNNVGERVFSFNYGLSNENGSFDFFLAPGNGTNVSLKNVANRLDAIRVIGLTMTLDDWVCNFGVHPEFLKIDVEGAEYLVLKGGMNYIQAHKPKILAELLRKWSAPFGYHPNEVLNFMFNIGYRCWSLGDSGIVNITSITDQTIETNFVFLHDHYHESTIAKLESLRLDV
jgi:FkbM family methyltransferase